MSFNSEQLSSSPLVWFLLLDSTTCRPYKGTTADAILRSSLFVPVVDKFRQAVKKKDKDYGKAALLNQINSSQLLVYKNKAAFDKRYDVDGKEEPLKEDALLDGLGNTEEEALIITIP